uniref:lipopolysaccharide kinase InaA family protein n=1 Tax=Flavobacterium sp. TaxID=239 RepID=UPI00404B351A
MKKTVHESYQFLSKEIDYFIENFKNSGELVDLGQRNIIKTFNAKELNINIKSFKKPNFINKIVYAYFRKSKAKRSYEFANKLISKGIGTPKPMAFFEQNDWIGLTNSYYVCEHIHADLTFRALVEMPDFPDHENILRQFTAFSYRLHQLGIEFKDHSPGNTLIKKENNLSYSFYLVDLNRMNFHTTMSFDLRMKNLCRLTPKEEMVRVMADEYAKHSGEKASTIFETLWKYTSEFQEKYHRKRAFKKKYFGK